MRVNTKVVIDMVTGEVLEHAWYEYSGPVDECKGDSTAKAAEQQQTSFSAALERVFKQQFAEQADALGLLLNTLKPQVQNPQGYSDQALTAMRTSATQNISSQYDNAQRALQNQNFVNGSRDLPSGVQDMQMGALKQGEASDTASAQNTITLNNENQRQSNYWNAIGALSGTSAQLNPLGYAGASTGAANSVAGLSEAYKNSQSSQLLGALGGVAGGVGAALSKYCWIAEALWGVDAIETRAVRWWLVNVYSKTRIGRVVVWFYATFGQQVAALVRRYSFVRRAIKPLFDAALRRATK